MTSTRLTTLASTWAFAVFAAFPAAAQDAGFGLELNNAHPVETGCRLTYVAQNSTGIDLAETSIEVAVFDKSGAVDQMLILDFGGLQDGKTKVVQFDLAGQSCEEISRLLVNGVAECAARDGDAPDCLDLLAPSSRIGIGFGI